MKRNIINCIIMLYLILCIVGCEDKPQTLNEAPSTTTTSTTASSTTTESTTTNIIIKDSTTTSSRKTTTSTTSTTTTTTKRTTTIKKTTVWKDDKNGTKIPGYKLCDSDNVCKCYLSNGTPREC